MVIQNPWTNYITRSYQQIKASLIQGLVTKAPEVTDHSESNILIIIVSMFSGVAEMLGYYIDNKAREAFLLSARRYDSLVKGTRILDYRIKAANPATCNIDIIFSLPIPLQGSGLPYQLPIGIEVQDANGVKFVSQNTSAVDIPAGSSDITLPFIQQATTINSNLGTSDGATLNQKFALPDGYVDNTLEAVIGGITYNRKDTFAYSFPQSLDFIIEVDETGTAYIVLGDGSNGKIPTNGDQIIASFKTTSGALGNLAAQTIITLNTSLTSYLPGGTTATVSNPNASTGGAGYEGIEDIRKRAPLSIRTLYRAVTNRDYVDVVLLHPGVSKADFNFTCGKSLDIFIVPINGGIAQSGLLTAVSNYLDEFKMTGTFPIIRPAGTTNIVFAADITLKARVDPTVATIAILAAIKNFFALANQNINKAVYKSVLDALIQDLEAVEFLDITKLTTRPYARLKVNPLLTITQSELSWTANVNQNCVTESDWQIVYRYDPITYPAGKFLITRDGIYQGDVLPNTIFTALEIDMIFNLISVTDYADLQSWEFTIYPYNQDIELNDYTIPAVLLDSSGNMPDVALNIIQQL